MKRLLSGLVVLTALGVGGALVVELFRSDESRIRRRLDTMAEGFNAPDVGDCASGLARGLTVRSARGGRSIDREQVTTFLRYLVLTRKDAKGRYNLSVAFDEESVRIEVREGDPKTAAVSLRARFRETNAEKIANEATLDIEAELDEDPEAGWQVRSASWSLVEGKMPL